MSLHTIAHFAPISYTYLRLGVLWEVVYAMNLIIVEFVMVKALTIIIGKGVILFTCRVCERVPPNLSSLQRVVYHDHQVEFMGETVSPQ